MGARGSGAEFLWLWAAAARARSPRNRTTTSSRRAARRGTLPPAQTRRIFLISRLFPCGRCVRALLPNAAVDRMVSSSSSAECVPVFGWLQACGCRAVIVGAAERRWRWRGTYPIFLCESHTPPARARARRGERGGVERPSRLECAGCALRVWANSVDGGCVST